MSATTVAFVEPKATPMNLAVAAQSVTGQSNPLSFVSPAGVRYELVYVTPELAEKWLVRNTGNRSLRPALVDKLARDLKAGNFLENGDAARFDEDGTLIDSQHRMHAIIASGVGAWMLVVSNLPAAARDTIDDGAKRTMADRFGFKGEAEPKTLASVVRRALLWNMGMPQANAKFQPSAMEYFEFFAAHPELVEATNAASHYRKAKLLRGSTIGLCWWLFSQIDADLCKEFFDRLDDGAEMKVKHPVLTLRNRLISVRRDGSTVTEVEATAWAIKAWNALREGREVVVIRYADHETYPQPK